MENPEVIIPQQSDSNGNVTRMIPPPCRLNIKTTLESPWFWLAVGFFGGCYFSHKKNKQ